MRMSLVFVLGITLALSACSTLKEAASVTRKAASKGKSFKLVEKEVWLLNSLFGKSLDTNKVRLVLASAVSYGAPKTVENEIHFPKEKANLEDPKFRNSKVFLALIAHECTHVWQFQNSGLRYIPDSLFNQGKGVLQHGSRSKAYQYTLDPTGEKPFQKYNSEQQAQLLQDYVNVKVFGRSAKKKCENWDEVNEKFTSVIETMIKRDVNPDFVPFDPEAAKSKLGV